MGAWGDRGDTNGGAWVWPVPCGLCSSSVPLLGLWPSSVWLFFLCGALSLGGLVASKCVMLAGVVWGGPGDWVLDGSSVSLGVNGGLCGDRYA